MRESIETRSRSRLAILNHWPCRTKDVKRFFRGLAGVLAVAFAFAVYAVVPTLVSPTVAPAAGYAKIGDVIGPITADGTTTAFRVRNIEGDHRVAFQIFGTWDGAALTGQMRICDEYAASLECPFVTMPVTTWPVTTDATGMIGNIQAYGRETEFRLSVASAGGSTSLHWVVRQ